MLQLASKFDSVVKKLETPLSRVSFATDEEIRASLSFQHKVEGIKSEPKKRNGRTDEAIEADCMAGQAAEIGIARLLGVEVYDAKWDLKDRSTFAKDVVYEGVRIEVKSHKHLRRFAVVNHSYNTMMKSLGEFDVVVFAHVERAQAPGNWIVTPTLIVDPYPGIIDFAKLWDDDEYSKVYRADQAYTRFLCQPLIDLEA